jgi:hypothetical protein
MRDREDQDLEVSSIIFFAAIHCSGIMPYKINTYEDMQWRRNNDIFWYRLVEENANREPHLARILNYYKTTLQQRNSKWDTWPERWLEEAEKRLYELTQARRPGAMKATWLISAIAQSVHRGIPRCCSDYSFGKDLC